MEVGGGRSLGCLIDLVAHERSRRYERNLDRCDDAHAEEEEEDYSDEESAKHKVRQNLGDRVDQSSYFQSFVDARISGTPRPRPGSLLPSPRG